MNFICSTEVTVYYKMIVMIKICIIIITIIYLNKVTFRNENTTLKNFRPSKVLSLIICERIQITGKDKSKRSLL